MQITQILIEGYDLNSLCSFIENILPHHHAYKQNEQVFIYANEKHYARSDGLILTTIILDIYRKHDARVQIIVGGGGSGLFNLEWDVEKYHSRNLVSLFKKYCKSQGWEITMIGRKIIEEYE